MANGIIGPIPFEGGRLEGGLSSPSTAQHPLAQGATSPHQSMFPQGQPPLMGQQPVSPGQPFGQAMPMSKDRHYVQTLYPQRRQSLIQQHNQEQQSLLQYHQTLQSSPAAYQQTKSGKFVKPGYLHENVANYHKARGALSTKYQQLFSEEDQKAQEALRRIQSGEDISTEPDARVRMLRENFGEWEDDAKEKMPGLTSEGKDLATKLINDSRTLDVNYANGDIDKQTYLQEKGKVVQRSGELNLDKHKAPPSIRNTTVRFGNRDVKAITRIVNGEEVTTPTDDEIAGSFEIIYKEGKPVATSRLTKDWDTVIEPYKDVFKSEAELQAEATDKADKVFDANVKELKEQIKAYDEGVGTGAAEDRLYLTDRQIDSKARKLAHFKTKFDKLRISLSEEGNIDSAIALEDQWDAIVAGEIGVEQIPGVLRSLQASKEQRSPGMEAALGAAPQASRMGQTAPPPEAIASPPPASDIPTTNFSSLRDLNAIPSGAVVRSMDGSLWQKQGGSMVRVGGE